MPGRPRPGTYICPNSPARSSQGTTAATLWLESDISALRDSGTDPRVEATFKDGRVGSFDHILIAIGGSTPEGFLRSAGVLITGKTPVVDDRHHTTIPGLFLAGDLVADGKGSIVKAFNSGHRVVWEGLCQGHLECRAPGEPTSRQAVSAVEGSL